jgi:hypothetical protein
VSLTIAVLTGRRPELLAQTLASFVEHHRDIWEAATRTVFHNTGDEPTSQVIDAYTWHDRETHAGPLLSIGQASQRLGAQVADAGTDYVLRLEDDWEAKPGDWWDDAVDLLGRVDQVRLLRGRSSRRCKVCRSTIVWRSTKRGHKVTRDAHYTHTPSLMRTGQFLKLFPYRDEPDAMRRFHGHPVAHLQPGVFDHLGGGSKSLKKNGGRR